MVKMRPTNAEASGSRSLGLTKKSRKSKSTATMELTCLPEDIMMLIMVFLPFKSVLLFRTVSKAWNAMLLDPLFQRIRASLLSKSLRLEFLTNVMQSSKFFQYRFERSTSNVLIMSHRHDLRVVSSSNFTVKELTPLECTLSLRKLEIFVLDVLAKKDTDDYVVFALSLVSPVLQRSSSIGQELSGPLAHMTANNLHCYDSATNVWTLCGSGLNLSTTWRQIYGFALHQGRYMVLARTYGSPPGGMAVMDEIKYEIFCYNAATDAWETLPGESLPSGNHGISIFDHCDSLYLAVPSFTGFRLWKYGDKTQDWSLVCDFRPPVQIEAEQNPGNWKFLMPYAHLFGDLLHFGEFGPPSGMARRRCRLLTYNLITGKVRDMSCDPAARVLPRRPNTRLMRLLRVPVRI